MTSPTPSPQTPQFDDRAFRSPMGIAGGVLLLGFGVWLVTDAVAYGAGRAPLFALAWLLLAAPLVTAFTLRPAVFAGEARMRVRNPFRTVTIPWARVESLRSMYSTEVVADGVTYQLWSVPVSMRARKRADRQTVRAASPARGGGLFGRRDYSDPLVPAPAGRGRDAADDHPALAPSDQTVLDLRELAERNAGNPGCDAAVTTRWAFEVMVPAVLGAIALLLLALL